MEPSSVIYFRSPIGIIEIERTRDGIPGRDAISSLKFIDYTSLKLPPSDPADECIRQLGEYFRNERKVFDLPLLPAGTEFQKMVWKELITIPFGETITYSELAERMGGEKLVRAVASANARNPIPILIPCHRVIGKDGHLTGYAGGLWRKQWLLELEGAYPKGTLF